MSVLTSLDVWGVMKQTSAGGFTYVSGYPRTFRATQLGPDTNNKIVSSTLAAYASDNASLPGKFIRVLRCGLGSATTKGNPLIREITEYAHASSALTIEALPFRVSTGDVFALYDSPTGYFCETSGGSQTNIVDTNRTEADDYFVGSAEQGGQYVIRKAADNIAAAVNALVYDFDAATDTLSTASLGANTAVGDLFQPIIWPESADGPLTLGQANIERGSVMGQMGQLRGVPGPREASGQKSLLFHGPGTARVGHATEWDVFLGSVFTTSTAAADWVLSTGSTTSNLTVSSGTPVAGRLYAAETGDVFMASAYSSPNVTALPALRVAPQNAQNVYGMREYSVAEAVQWAIAHLQWHGRNVKDLIVGSVPTITFEAVRGDYCKMMLNFTGADGYRVHLDASNAALSRPYNAKTSTITPQQCGSVRMNLDGTEIELLKLTVDMGITLELQQNLSAPNAVDGPSIRQVRPTFAADVLVDTDSEAAYQKLIQSKPMTMLAQVNEAVGLPGIFAMWAYEVELTTAEGPNDDAGQKTWSLQGKVTVDTTQTSLAQWKLATA